MAINPSGPWKVGPRLHLTDAKRMSHMNLYRKMAEAPNCFEIPTEPTLDRHRSADAHVHIVQGVR
jgi:hypothetical protein